MTKTPNTITTADLAQTGEQTGAPRAPKARRPRRMARESAAPSKSANASAASITEPAKSRSESKIAGVIALLKRDEGATLAELVEATGWLPHTTRAALTGLKNKGHVIAKTKRGEATCYKIEEAA